MYNNFAKIYDKFMKECDYDQWTSCVVEKIKMYNPEGKSLLDLGCGTGESLIRLKELYTCSGLDLSKEMLEIAHKKLKNKGVNLFLGDMREFYTGEKYDIIISLFDTVNHLTAIEDLNDLFSSVKENLNPNGIYIFDVVDREFMNKMFPGGIFYDERKDMTIIWEHWLENNLDFIEANFFVKNKNNTYDKYKEYYEKKIFTEEEIKKELQNNDLTLLTIDKNDRIAGERFFYVAKKS